MINPAMAIYDNHRKDIGIPKIINNDQEQDGWRHYYFFKEINVGSHAF